MAISKKAQRKVLEVAKKHVYSVKERGDLETRYHDAEDFIDISVWCLKAALEEAYELGLKEWQHEKE